MRLGNGVKIDRFAKGGSRTPLSEEAANELVDALNALLNPTIGIGATNAVTISDGGWNIQLKQLGTSSAASTTTGAFKVKQEFGDYLQCVTWDFAAEGTTFVYVAKPTLLRRSMAGRTEDGITATFAYALVTATFPYSYTNWQRTQHVTIPAGLFDDETHILKPGYLASGLNIDGTAIAGGDIIYAIGVTATGVSTNPADAWTPGFATAITWLDMNPDGRCWKQIAVLPSP